MYGLLAVAVVLVLAGRDWSSRADAVDVKHLAGKTGDGYRITLGVVDGQLQNFDTVVRTDCTGGRTWKTRWYPADGNPVPFHQDGGHIHVVERTRRPELDPPFQSAFTMDGSLADDGAVARGRIDAHALWGRGDDSVACHGTTTFHATARD